jgi:hypothetical protein
MSHKSKDCMERPRKKGAKLSGTEIAADELIEDITLKGFEAKRDRWNGYDAAEYSRIIDLCASHPHCHAVLQGIPTTWQNSHAYNYIEPFVFALGQSSNSQ